MNQKIIVGFIFLALCFQSALAKPQFVEKNYTGFKVWLDCAHHGAVAYFYAIGKDTANEKRSGSFCVDDTVPSRCQPISKKSYRTSTVPRNAGKWDRGHLIPANHMDHSKQSMKESFFLTNVLPQAAIFNQKKGAWFYTELLTECYRDLAPLKVWRGVVWGSDTSNDYFTSTHGVTTPDFWWKVIYRTDTGQYNAWWFPNKQTTTAIKIDDYLMSIKSLKEKLGFIPDFHELEESRQASIKPESTWEMIKRGRKLKCGGIGTSIK